MTSANDRLSELLLRINRAAAAKYLHPGTNGPMQLEQLAQRLGREIPGSISRLLQEVTPLGWQAGFKHETVRLMEFSEMEWFTPHQLAEFGFTDRLGAADYFAFAAGIFGEAICVRCAGGLEGRILLDSVEECQCLVSGS